MAADMDVKQRFFPHTQDELKEIASDILRSREGARWNRRGHGNLRGRRAFRHRAARRSRDHRAQPRQDGRRDGVHRQEAGQREHGGLFPRGAEGHRRGRVQHRALHRRGRLRPASPKPELLETAPQRPRSLPSVESTPTKPSKSRGALGSRRVRDRPAHQEFRRRERLGAALAVRARHIARLSRRLSVLAPLHRVRADRRQRPRHAARRLVHVEAQRRRSGRARSGRPLRGAARALAHGRAQSRHAQGAACCSRRRSRPASARRVRAGGERRRAVSQDHLPRRQPRQAGVRAARAGGRRSARARAAWAARRSTKKACARSARRS